MDRDAAVALIQQRLGNRTDLASRIVAEMQLVQADVFETDQHPLWFQVSRTAFDTPLSTVAAQRALALPTDFLLEFDDATPEILSGDAWVPLVKDEVGYLQNKYGGDTGIPVYYAYVGGKLELFPTPDAVYSLRLLYYAKGESLSTNVENIWLANAGTWFIDSVTATVAAKYLMNPQLAAIFEGSAKAAAARVRVRDEALRQTNRMLSMGDD